MKVHMTAVSDSGPGRTLGRAIADTGRTALFFLLAASRIRVVPVRRLGIFGRTLWFGPGPVAAVGLAGALAGMMLGRHAPQALLAVGAGDALGAFVAFILVREIGPVLTAVVVTPLAGAALAARIGRLRAGRQIEALETMDVDPIRFLVSPKLAGALVSLPVLSALFIAAGIVAGGLGGAVFGGVAPGAFFAGACSGLLPADLAAGFAKAAVFGAVLTSVCCYRGYVSPGRQPVPGAGGVSLPATGAVVHSYVLIFIADAVLTLIWN